MHTTQKGFTLIELMIVVVVIGILAAISIPNFVAMQNRAKEGSTKANMHTLQLAAEDYGVQNEGTYAANAASVAVGLPGTFKNPFDGTSGMNNAWEDRVVNSAGPNPKSGLVSYADSSGGAFYNIKGFGKKAALPFVLTSGQ
jgi:prepilin-type N-terminal cleavage/methylation domain-containing protein